jgi:hypothetical protein
MGLSLPVEVSTSSSGSRRYSKLARCHVVTGTIERSHVHDAGGDVQVASPELCFLQLAARLPLAKLVELGLEIWGSYSLPGPVAHETLAEGKGFYGRQPLTSAQAIRRLIDTCGGANGATRASTALEYVADGSASPMESTLSILLTLPYRHGGYGLPMPDLNHRVASGARGGGGRSSYRCDLYWPDAKVAAEYDSDMYHTGSTRIASDSIRRSGLALAGITVVSVTRRQVLSIAEFDKVARLLAKHMGRRLRQGANARYAEAQRDLRRMLLPAIIRSPG